MNENDIIFLTVEEASDHIKVARKTVYRYLKHKTNPIPHYRISSRNIRIRQDQLDQWVDSFLREGLEKGGEKNC